MANYSRNGGRGGSRDVDGQRIVGPWEDMKRNKWITKRRRRRMEKRLERRDGQ